MGSGIFVAAVVVAWFVVLVPMVLTRRDSAVDKALSEEDSSSARVLHRARRLHTSRRRPGMTSRETSPSQATDDAGHASYDDPAYDDTIDTAVHERITAEVVDDTAPDVDDERDAGAGSRLSAEELMGRRRRTLLMLLGLVGAVSWAMVG